jgi:hypoxanthine phosphoribosyltransferase
VQTDDATTIPEHLRRDIGEILIDAPTLEAKLAEIGARVNADYEGREVLLVGVLKGAVMVMADFARHLTIPCAMDFMAVSSYGSSTRSSGVVRILKDLDTEIEGRDILIVEDIVDSGLTLDWLLRNLRSRNPNSIEVMALLTKPAARQVDVPIKYTGFAIQDQFVVGYGLDLNEKYRNLPFVGVLTAEAEAAAQD